MDHDSAAQEHYIVRPWYPGFFFIVPFTPHEDLLQTRIHLVITASQGIPPAFIRGSPRRRIWSLPAQRAVSGTAEQLLPILDRLSRGDSNVLNALLCYTRGDVASVACDDCLEGDAPLTHCVSAGFTFRERCANCILNCRTNCTYALRRTPEIDDDYNPGPSFEAATQSDRQRQLCQMQLRSRQTWRRRQEEVVKDEDHLNSRRRPRWRGSGTAVDPFDLTGDTR